MFRVPNPTALSTDHRTHKADQSPRFRRYQHVGNGDVGQGGPAREGSQPIAWCPPEDGEGFGGHQRRCV